MGFTTAPLHQFHNVVIYFRVSKKTAKRYKSESSYTSLFTMHVSEKENIPAKAFSIAENLLVRSYKKYYLCSSKQNAVTYTDIFFYTGDKVYNYSFDYCASLAAVMFGYYKRTVRESLINLVCQCLGTHCLLSGRIYACILNWTCVRLLDCSV